MAAYFTIGHSTRSVEELAALLLQAQVDLLVDVRTMPRSRTSVSSRSRISACVVTSSAVVGSSAISSFGRHDSAMAMAAR